MANLTERRWMDIDESSGDVAYTGNWFVDSYDRPGPFRALGSLSGRSAHGIASEGGFSFSFEGTDFDVRGQSSVNFSATNSRIRCTIDGVEAQTDAGTVNEDNFRNFRLCLGRRLSAGPHEVVVQITPGPNTVVWVDTVTYYSLAYPNIRRKHSQLTPEKSEFQFTGVGWRDPFDDTGSLGRETYTNGDKAIIPFFGTSVEFCGYITPGMPQVAGSAAYSLDGGPLVRIELPIWTPAFRGAAVDDFIWNCVMQTPALPPGQHILELVNLGNPSTVPLAVDYFLVSHGDIDNPMKLPDRPGQVIATAAPNPSASTTSTISASSGPKKIRVGPIVGGVVGAIAVFVCIGLLFYFWHSRRRRLGKAQPLNQWTSRGTEATPNPSTFHGAPAIPLPQPFITPAQTVMDDAFDPTAPPPSYVQQPPPRSSRDSMSSLYTNTPPSRPPQLRHGLDSEQPPWSPSPTSVLSGSDVHPVSALAGQYDSFDFPTKRLSPRLHTTN